MRMLIVWSRTHYGRGTPLKHEETCRNIRLALATLDFVAPGLPIYGYADEDYGWACLLSPEQEAEICQRFPTSLREFDYVYIHTEDAEYADMLVVDGVDVQAVIHDQPDYNWQLPIARNFEAMYADWFNNYGRWDR